MTWKYFAVAASQEPDIRKLSYLLKQLHNALDKANPEQDEMRALSGSGP